MQNESQQIIISIYNWVQYQQNTVYQAKEVETNQIKKAALAGKSKAYLDVISYLYSKYGAKIQLSPPT